MALLAPPRALPRLTLAVLFAAGCNGVLGLEGFPRGDGASVAPAFDFADPACGDCMTTRCDEPQSACAADASCHGVGTCVAKCEPGDLACRTACTDDPFFEKGTLHDDLDACRRTQCSSACLGPGGLAPADADEACTSCVDMVCGEAVAACLADAGCESVFGCLQRQACTDPECLLRCGYDGPFPVTAEVEPLFDAVRACWGDCAACGSGDALACAGNFSWGQTAAETIIIDVEVIATKGIQIPAEGVLAKACFAFDVDCGLPHDSATVDADGRVRLEVPTEPTGWDGFLYFTGTLPDPIGTPVVPTRYYFGRPLTRSERLTDIALVDHATLDLVGTLVGTTIDGARGHLAVGTADCRFDRGRGLRLAIDDGTMGATSYYTVDNAFVADDGTLATDASGLAGVLNVLPSDQPRTVSAFLPGAEDTPYGTYAVHIRAGELTSLHAVPGAE